MRLMVPVNMELELTSIVELFEDPDGTTSMLGTALSPNADNGVTVALTVIEWEIEPLDPIMVML